MLKIINDREFIMPIIPMYPPPACKGVPKRVSAGAHEIDKNHNLTYCDESVIWLL